MFDYESTHSFVLPQFVSKLNLYSYEILKLNLYSYEMEKPLIVTIPLKEVFMAKYVYKSYVVCVKDKDTLENLVLHWH